MPAQAQRVFIATHASAKKAALADGLSESAAEGRAFRIARSAAQKAAGAKAGEEVADDLTMDFAVDTTVMPAFMWEGEEYVPMLGVSFKAGTYKGMGPDGTDVTVTEDDLDQMVANFKAPVPLKVAHSDTPFDGKLGHLMKVYRDGKYLRSLRLMRKSLVDALGPDAELKSSISYKNNSIIEESLTSVPRVKEAVMMAEPLEDEEAPAVEFAEWDQATVNDLPDSAFLWVGPGGKKDGTGRTVPRTLRKFPYRNAAGKVDLPHLRNAIARAPQADVPDNVKTQVQAKARRILEQQSGGKGAEFAETETMLDHLKQAQRMLDSSGAPDAVKNQMRGMMKTMMGMAAKHKMSEERGATDSPPADGHPQGGAKPVSFIQRMTDWLRGEGVTIPDDAEMQSTQDSTDQEAVKASGPSTADVEARVVQLEGENKALKSEIDELKAGREQDQKVAARAAAQREIERLQADGKVSAAAVPYLMASRLGETYTETREGKQVELSAADCALRFAEVNKQVPMGTITAAVTDSDMAGRDGKTSKQRAKEALQRTGHLPAESNGGAG